MNSTILYSVPVTPKPHGQSSVHRNPNATHALFKPQLQTMQQMWNRNVQKYHHNPCLENYTYQKVDQVTSAIGSWLISNGLELVYIHSNNRVQWTLIDVACAKYGVITVPLYDTLGKQALDHILKLTEGKIVFSSKDSLVSLLKTSPTEIKVIRQMVLLDEISQEQKSKIETLGIKTISLKSILSHSIIEPREVKPDDIFSLMFTSGTTGIPKGVTITHSNFASQIPASLKLTNYGQDPVHFSYLPLAHIFERMVQAMVLYSGGIIAYGSGNIANFVQDLQKIRPTNLPLVPRLFNRLYQMIRPLKHVDRELAQKALKVKTQNYQKGIKTCQYDQLVFKPVNDLFGGRLRLIMVGSAPISGDILKFFKTVLDAKISEVYGQTQSTGTTFITVPGDPESGYVGGPSQLIQFKLADIPQMKYLSSDNPPKGQICIRGVTVFAGYYKDKKNTNQTIDSQGWLHSGDVGQLLPNGSVKIVDRKKNIYKLSQGQYVAPQKVQNVYKHARTVSEVFVYGDSLRDFNVAIIVPNIDVLSEQGIIGTMEQVCSNPKAAQVVYNNMREVGTKQGLLGFQQAKKIRLFPQSFSTLGIVTSTMKLQRNQAKQYFKELIEKIYQS